MESIYTRIKNRREELGYTQDELALKLGYKNRSSIHKIESGVNDIPQSKIEAFAKELNTTPAYLMGWDVEKKDDEIYYHNKQLGVLINASKDLSSDNLNMVIDMMKRLKN